MIPRSFGIQTECIAASRLATTDVVKRRREIIALREQAFAKADAIQQELEKSLASLKQCTRESAGRMKYTKSEGQDLDCFKTQFMDLIAFRGSLIESAVSLKSQESVSLSTIFSSSGASRSAATETLRQLRSDFNRELYAGVTEIDKRSARFGECRKSSAKNATGVMANVPEAAVYGSGQNKGSTPAAVASDRVNGSGAESSGSALK